MGYDMRPVSWGSERPKISAKLKPCKCGIRPTAEIDTAGMYSVKCWRCSLMFMGDDGLGCETWQELVREWNRKQ